MIYTHNKTGNVYEVLKDNVINATNGNQDGQKMILYKNIKGEWFIREYNEFHLKFTRKKGKNLMP